MKSTRKAEQMSKTTHRSSMNSPRVYDHDELGRLHRVGSSRRLFPRKLSDTERREAFERALVFEEQRDAAKARGTAQAKWVASVLPITSGTLALAVGEESKLRKDLAAAEAKVAEARRREEVLADATGQRWEEVEVDEYADDIDETIINVRMDTLTEISRRRMGEGELKAAEKRRQGDLFTH